VPPFIRAISDTSPTSKLNVTFLQRCASEPQRRRPAPRTTDSGVQLPQCQYLRDVGGQHPRKTILSKKPAGPLSEQSRGDTNRASMGQRTYWRWMASRKQRPGTGPSANSVRRFCGATRNKCRAQAQQRHWGAHGRAPGLYSDYYAALATRPDMVSCGNRAGLVPLKGARFRWGTVEETAWARHAASTASLRARTSTKVGAAA
jgi:hypothetical protein